RAELQHAALSPEQCARFDEGTLVELFERSGGLPLRVDHEAAALLREDFELGQGGSRSLSLGAQIVSVGGAGSEEALPRDPDPPAGPLHALGDLQAEVAGPPPERRPAPPFSRPRRRAVESAWVQLGLAFVAGIAVTIGIGTLGGSEPAQVAVAPQPEAQVDIPIPALEPSPRVVRAASEPAPLIRDEVPELVPPLAEEAPEIVPAETAAVVLEAPHEETTAPPVEVAAVVPEPEEPIAPVVAPTPLLIDLNARPWASISIDGVEVGETPLAEVPVIPGLHRFAATLPDGSVVEREIEIGPNNRHIVF
ncbi:MAG: hypothetical protein O7G30_03170, partial [Proteobacteria bacterium]|nr:hypothetical protein [Pseudomonadota bacterium]